MLPKFVCDVIKFVYVLPMSLMLPIYYKIIFVYGIQASFM